MLSVLETFGLEQEGVVTGLVDDLVDCVQYDHSYADADNNQTQEAQREDGDEKLPLILGHRPTPR